MERGQMKRIAVCDDDPQDREAVLTLLREYLDQHELSVGVDAYSGGEAFLADELDSFGLVILDIFMQGLNGIETARRIRDAHPDLQIIFCSSSNAYAAESYEVCALQYLTKPVQREKLFSTLDRFFRSRLALRTLSFRYNRLDEQVYLDRVLWIETRDHRCVIHTLDGDFETRTTLQQLKDQLCDGDFVKPIRYALVSLQAVATVSGDMLLLKNGETIPISRNLRVPTKAAFAAYKRKQLLGGGVAL